MIRRSKRQEADELRSEFIANREKVRSWMTDWDCREVVWPAFPDVPQPWSVLPGEERSWLQHHAPYITDYGWLLVGESVSQAITHVHGHWRFGQRHEFESLDIDIRCTVLDPGYLAETLALGAHAANLTGWREDDLQPLYEWLFAGADTRPPHHGVRGQKRTGLILFEFRRWPRVIDGPGIIAQLNMKLTETTLDGSPLDENGGST
ncbi:hypothetical protein [Nocardia australiensis]|uniref:hypothetical protein n=1 Tax=Nocardia australiensis TaxID=2887191 RepID=UPI001D140C01|nr:hypothetical protein [Nocardia australiensis]